MPISSLPLACLLLPVPLVFACYSEIRFRRIPNWLTLAMMVFGLGAGLLEGDWAGLLDALIGLAVGGGVFLPFCLMGALGGGDLKLMAGVGAMVGWPLVLPALAHTCLAGGVLGDCEATLRRALEAKGIALSVGVGVAEITAEGLTLANGRTIADDLLLCSTGARPNGPAAGTEGYLKTGGDLSLAPCVYAAGDPAEPPASRPTCSVRRAQLMGQLAAKNLLAELAGQPTQPWADPRLPLFMKVGDVEFHTLGDVRSPGLLEKCVEETPPFIRKTILRRGDQVVGLRWVGTRAGFADWEKQLA